MALLQWVMFWVLAPVAALALELSPAEMPPADFPSQQYIDSTGCVFLRDTGGSWLPRVARDGTAVCGYPPTMSARGMDGKPLLRALDPNAGKTQAEIIAAALSEKIVTNLQEGELKSDPAPLQTLPDMGPEPASTAPMDALKAALVAVPAVREGMGRDIKPNRRLCELLGYDATPVPAGVGRDPTQGFCGSLPDADLARLAFNRPVGQTVAVSAPKPKAQFSPPATAPATAVMTAAATAAAAEVTTAAPPASVPMAAASKPAPDQTAKPVPGPKVAKPLTPAKHRAPDGKLAKSAEPAKPPKVAAQGNQAMIPAGARYVRLGTFADASAAARAAVRAAQLGFPLLRGKEGGGGDKVFLLAGPFNSREQMVRAIDAIRKAGFRNAYAM